MAPRLLNEGERSDSESEEEKLDFRLSIPLEGIEYFLDPDDHERQMETFTNELSEMITSWLNERAERFARER